MHSSFYSTSAELHIRGFQCFSPFMVTVAEVLALKKILFWNTQLSEYMVIIPKYLHVGLLPYFILLGLKLGVLKADWEHEATERGNLLCSGAAFHLLPTSHQAFRLIMLGSNVTAVIGNTFCHEYVTHTHIIAFQTMASSLTYFLRWLHECACPIENVQLFPKTWINWISVHSGPTTQAEQHCLLFFQLVPKKIK